MATGMDVKKDIQRALTLLRNKIRERGFTQLEVQAELNWGRSYISQLLTKQKGLRVDQILRILDVIGVEPADFYAELYHLGNYEAGVRNYDDYLDRSAVRGDTATAEAPEPTDDDLALREGYHELRTMLRAVVELLVKKDVVSENELNHLAREQLSLDHPADENDA